VRIRNSATALNFLDILQVQDKYQVKPRFVHAGRGGRGVIDAVAKV